MLSSSYLSCVTSSILISGSPWSATQHNRSFSALFPWAWLQSSIWSSSSVSLRGELGPFNLYVQAFHDSNDIPRGLRSWLKLGLGVVVAGRCPVPLHLSLSPLRNAWPSPPPTFPLKSLSWQVIHSMYFHDTALSTMTAAWLLPIVAPIVASASGGIVASVLPDPRHALWTIITSYILWGIGVPLAMVVLVIYFQRLTMYKIPPREVIVSVLLPLGPLGQGGFAVMQLGTVSMRIFPLTKTLPAVAAAGGRPGDILYIMGWVVALVMWGFGVVWLFFALASISRSSFPFNMGWWGFTFPLGVLTVSTTTIGKETESRFFDVLGTVCECCISRPFSSVALLLPLVSISPPFTPVPISYTRWT